jgi:DHA1 family bicyclomycin/chloramphenicol resistance-like MFS transporter
MPSSYARNAIVLGLLAAVGPFAIDMYLPALPTIAADLKASSAATQMTLTVFFLTIGLCQLFYGPLSDMLGRKPPLYFGLALYSIGAIGCAASGGIDWLIFFRFVQGLGASSVMVIPRAIIRDLHTGVEATKLMSLVMLVLSVSPILAPLVGSALIVPFGWRAVFVAVTLVAVIALVLVAFSLPETQPPERRIKVSFRDVLRRSYYLLGDRYFVGLTFIGGLGMASFFAFLGGSSFVYIDHFHLTPTQYSLAFALNAIGFIGASQFSAKLGTRFGMGRVVIGAISIFTVLTAGLFIATIAGIDSLPLLIVVLFFSFACLGPVIPSSMVLALEEQGEIAGIASALGGTLQMVTGGAVIAVVSLFSHGTALPMVATIALSAFGAFVLSLVTLRRRRLASQLAA